MKGLLLHILCVLQIRCTAAAERRELFRFSADLGKLALRIADQYGTSFEKWLVQQHCVQVGLLTRFEAALSFCS